MNAVPTALVGAGIHAQRTYVSAFRRVSQELLPVVVFSRSEERASLVAQQLRRNSEVSTDLNAIINRHDIQALCVMVPIPATAQIVALGLQSGKHVISEKPIAINSGEGRRLIELAAQHPKLVWMVAENYRYQPAFNKAQEILSDHRIGAARSFHWAVHIDMSPRNNPYYDANWRRDGSLPGGMILDYGVHLIAALRRLFGDVTSVSALVHSVRPDLGDVDGITATLCFDTGVIGCLQLSMAAPNNGPNVLHIATDRAFVSVYPYHKVVVDHIGHEAQEVMCPGDGTPEQLRAFAAAIRGVGPHDNTPEEALADVLVVEALLRAAAGSLVVSL
jgi:predicted dehydrogenase